ncbi:MAG: nitroreductase family protein [Tissierella sp.]|uniref:nitroreductase family protein n=1 Tax=Tissierella sp. TaxID=41274 RepID=UPI003F9D9AF0
MIIKNFLRSRRSVREFKNRPLNPDTLDEIKGILNALVVGEDREHINLSLYEKGENISTKLEGKAGYAGVMIDSPHYIALNLKDKEDKTLIEAGYYIEKLVTELVNLNLATCWIQIENVSDELKREIFGEKTDHVDYLLAFGKEKRTNPFNEKPYSIKKGVEEIVYNEEIDNNFLVEELENKGLMDIFYYIRFAPSTKNLQPCRFLIKDNKVELLIRYMEWYESILIDAGIMMYYFEKLANYQGMNNKWQLVDSKEVKTSEDIYRKVAEYKL